MNPGILYSVLSLLAMSLAPLFNKFSSSTIGWAWGAALNAFFCFVIAGVMTRPNHAAFSKLFTRSTFRIAATNSIGLLLWYAATAKLAPPTLSVLGRLSVVFSIFLGHFLLHERYRRSEFLTIALAVVGALLFCWSGNFEANLPGIVLCLGYCFFFAWTNIQIKEATATSDSNQILLSNSLISASLLIPIAVFCEGSPWSLSLSGVTLIFGAAFTGGWLGLLLFYESLRRITFGQATFIRAFSPLIGVAVSWPFFPVNFSAIQIFGGGLMVFAVLVQALLRLNLFPRST